MSKRTRRRRKRLKKQAEQAVWRAIRDGNLSAEGVRVVRTAAHFGAQVRAMDCERRDGAR